MGFVNIKITELKPYSKNAKKHSSKQIQQVAESIKRFGFIQPLCIDKNNEVIIGHCRLESAKLLNLTEVPVVKLENLTGKEVKALRLADNKLNESDWEIDLVIEELKELDNELVELTGFDQTLVDGSVLADEINELAKQRGIDLGQYNIMTVEAPEAPRLKARMSFYFNNIEEFNKVKEYFKLRGGDLDTEKLIKMI